jgi:peroxiredoxin
MRDDLTPGHTFPDLQLPDHTGQAVQLSALLGGWPAAVVFVRGHY